MFYQTDQAANTQQVGEEMREDRKSWFRDLKTVNVSFDVLWDRVGLVLMAVAGLACMATFSYVPGAAALLVFWRRMHMVMQKPGVP